MFNDATYLPGSFEIKRTVIGGDAGPFRAGTRKNKLSLPKGFTGAARIGADPENTVEEIVEENNAAGINILY